ncbi:MAG TPA: superoxide dismutase, Ni [Ilumatobacteraceae bacterium]
MIRQLLFRGAATAHAHCDLFCGVYDPAQAKIEALSVLKSAQKYHESDDEVFKARAIAIKEERAELTKHHLMVLWADFFTPDHVAQFPQLHDLFWRAIRKAGEAKKSVDPKLGEELVALIDEISDIFWQTEKATTSGVYPPK